VKRLLKYSILIYINDNEYIYVKVNINKKFKTFNNEISALYYYILIDAEDKYDNNNFSIDKNNFVLITTPVLKYKDVLYNIANDEKISIIKHEKNITNDIIVKLLLNKCYTICDNYNIIIALYQEKKISIKQFLNYIKSMSLKKNSYFTNSKWLEHIYNHGMMNICDFPYMQLMLTPNLFNNRISKSLRKINYFKSNIYNITNLRSIVFIIFKYLISNIVHKN
jgi:hypothetical protein